jgi:L-ascorbate metabolism protein UlaG (beta-lactamase superfamily)
LLACAFSAAVQADVTLTQLANAGIIISDGKTRIMIDGMVVEPYSLYGGLPAEAHDSFRAASGDFAGIDLALVSHRHHEHNQPAFACEFMRASTNTQLYTSEQVIALMREKCRPFVTSNPRVHRVDPPYGEPYRVDSAGAVVSIFRLTHGRHKLARIEHFGHLVEIGGMAVLHIGDAAMLAEDFERAALHQRKIDIALIPLKFFQPGPGEELIRRYLDAPLKIATHIPPGELQEAKSYLSENFPTVQIIERPLEMLRFSGYSPPPP